MIDFNSLLQNQFLTGLLVAGGIGALTYSGRSIWNWTWGKIKRSFSSTISLNSEDSGLYADVCNYIFSLDSFKNVKTLNITDRRTRNLGRETSNVVSPANGTYFGRVRYRPIWVNIGSESKQTGGKTYFITVGAISWNNSFWKEKIDKIIQEKEKLDCIEIRVGDRCSTPRKKRSLNSVFLEGGVKEEIVSIIEKFSKSEDFYHKCGIPYGLNFLFCGPSGTGKTSLIFALASHFNKNILTIPASFTESSLGYALETLSENQWLIFEDIDVSGADINREEKNTEEKISLSTLLNVLDGFQRPEGSMIFLTTNRPEILDSALVRPGRINKIYHLNYYSREFAEKVSQELTGKPLEIEGETICPADLINQIHLKSL